MVYSLQLPECTGKDGCFVKILANIIGLSAVAMFVLSYQCKQRRGILFFNAGSRVLYVLQYILLGAFSGAALDISAFLVSVVTGQKERSWIKKYPRLVILTANVFLIAVGLMFYENIFSLLPIFGVLFETGALWLNQERKILWVSLLGAPFWLAYNLLHGAFGAASGNILTLVSIGIALFRRKEE